MAARLCDSFDAYLTADLLLRWTTKFNIVTINAGTGRNSTSSLHVGSPNGQVTKTLDNQATWIIGVAFQTNLFTAGNGLPLLLVIDNTTTQVDLRYDSNGHLYVTRNGTTLGTSILTLTAGAYAYIELKVLINSTVGTIDLHVNGTSWLSLTGQNTQASANAYAQVIQLGTDTGNTATWDYDDLYVLDGTGSANNAFLGDTRVQALRSTGAGHSTQFALGAGTSNWEAVSEATEDGDTTYVDSATAGQIDTYTFGALTPVSGTIPFIQTMLVARKDDAGIRTVADVISDGITDHVGASNNVGTSYQQWLTIHETDPVTSAAFTLANVNARQYGVEEVA